jgi:hypothetical protein
VELTITPWVTQAVHRICWQLQDLPGKQRLKLGVKRESRKHRRRGHCCLSVRCSQARYTLLCLVCLERCPGGKSRDRAAAATDRVAAATSYVRWVFSLQRHVDANRLGRRGPGQDPATPSLMPELALCNSFPLPLYQKPAMSIRTFGIGSGLCRPAETGRGGLWDSHKSSAQGERQSE